MKKKRTLLPILAIALFATACQPLASSSPALDPKALVATYAAATIAAMPTFTPWPTSTLTPPPTRDPSAGPIVETPMFGGETPTPGPSLTPLVMVETSIVQLTANSTGIILPGSRQTFACEEVVLKPYWNEEFDSLVSFQLVWKVQNVGLEIWRPKEVFLVYHSGEKLHKDEPIEDIPFSVYPKTNVRLTVNMRAPQLAGQYITTWALRNENSIFCSVTITIKVVPR